MDGFAFVFVLFCFLLPPGRRNYDFIVKLSEFVFFARVCVCEVMAYLNKKAGTLLWLFKISGLFSLL